MLHESITYDPQPEYQLYTTAKRYWLPEFDAYRDDPDALTLLVLHSTSFHKETWEPSLEHLFKLASCQGPLGVEQDCGLLANGNERGGKGLGCGKKRVPVKIREAWSLDCPNHGEAAVLNEEALKLPENLNNCAYGVPPRVSFFFSFPFRFFDHWQKKQPLTC